MKMLTLKKSEVETTFIRITKQYTGGSLCSKEPSSTGFMCKKDLFTKASPTFQRCCLPGEMHVRETANRGPLLLDATKTKALGYLDELNFRLARDDHDFHCRARVDKQWVTGHIHVGFYVLIAEGGVRINKKAGSRYMPDFAESTHTP